MMQVLSRDDVSILVFPYKEGWLAGIIPDYCVPDVDEDFPSMSDMRSSASRALGLIADKYIDGPHFAVLPLVYHQSPPEAMQGLVSKLAADEQYSIEAYMAWLTAVMFDFQTLGEALLTHPRSEVIDTWNMLRVAKLGYVPMFGPTGFGVGPALLDKITINQIRITTYLQGYADYTGCKYHLPDERSVKFNTMRNKIIQALRNTNQGVVVTPVGVYYQNVKYPALCEDEPNATATYNVGDGWYAYSTFMYRQEDIQAMSPGDLDILADGKNVDALVAKADGALLAIIELRRKETIMAKDTTYLLPN